LTVHETRNRTVWIAIGVLALLLIIGSAAGGGKSKTSKPPPPPPLDNARAVIISGGDGSARTVVVSPCQAPVASTRQNVGKHRPTRNAVVFETPAQPAARIVLVPDCIKPDPGQTASGESPAAAFVLPVGSQKPSSPTLKVAAQTQVLVPRGSRATTVIVPPCTGAAVKRDVVLSPGPGTTVATAPAC
jgi:hypothetical protein